MNFDLTHFNVLDSFDFLSFFMNWKKFKKFYWTTINWSKSIRKVWWKLPELWSLWICETTIFNVYQLNWANVRCWNRWTWPVKIWLKRKIIEHRFSFIRKSVQIATTSNRGERNTGDFRIFKEPTGWIITFLKFQFSLTFSIRLKRKCLWLNLCNRSKDERTWRETPAGNTYRLKYIN